MSAPQPKSIANEVWGLLEYHFNANEPVSPFVIKQLNAKATQLENVNISEASIVRAAIAGLQWNLAETDRWLKNAVHFDKSSHNLANIAVTYSHSNQFERAAEYLRMAYELTPMDSEFVNRYVNMLKRLGHLGAATVVWNKAVESGVKIKSVDECMDGFLSAMAEIGVSEDRIVKELAAAKQVLTTFKKRPKSVDYTVDVDHDGNKSLVVSYKFVGDILEELRMESTLAQILGEDDDWNPCLLSTEFNYLVAHDNEHA